VVNLYWPVYLNLEKGVDELAFSIHIDDVQLTVYSSRITDLILRAGSEIESISKDLYHANGGTESGNIKFDYDALKHLNGCWDLESKHVSIGSSHCFQSTRVLKPFVKNEKRTGTDKPTYGWNNSYQNLRHARAGSLEFGRLQYLFDIMAALYLLNIYYKNDVIPMESDAVGVTFPNSLGSSLFSIEVAKNPNYDTTGNYVSPEESEKYTYLIIYSEETRNALQPSRQPNALPGNSRPTSELFHQRKYEAVLNKKQFS
jgi:hypothetical protein